MVMTEPLKDLLHVLAMVGLVPGVNEYVVNVYDHKLEKELPEHLVHEALEHGWGVGKAEQHNAILIVPSRGDEGCPPFVTPPDPNEVECAPQVQLREDACPTEFLECSRNQVKRIGKFYRLGIQSSISNARPQAMNPFCY